MNPAAGPMQGIRVVDLSTIVAGPMVTQMLADQGADVIKVEEPRIGDKARATGSSRGGMSSVFHMFNRGKRSVALDLKTQAGKDILHRLIARADVLLHNFRPGVMQRMGLDYASLREAYPELVYVAISGFGDVGPMAGQPAFDHIIQCHAGFAAVQAGAGTDGEPDLIRNVVVDKLTALTAAQATTAALYARANGAGGQEVKLSMLGSAIAFLWPDAASRRHLLGDDAEVRPGLADHCRLYPFQGGHATFSGTDQSFAALCRDLDAPAGNDPRLQSAAGRVQELGLMEAVEQQWTASAKTMGVDEGLAIIEASGAPCAKVLSLEEVEQDAQVVANGYLRVAEHPVAGPLREARPAAEFSGTPAPPARPAPMLGQHTGELLAELGIDASEQEALRRQGAFGATDRTVSISTRG